MKDHSVEFMDRWNRYLSQSSVLELDGSWPSVGVLDLITYSLRNEKKSTKEGKELIHGVSLYIAELVKKAWKAAGADVEIHDADHRGVVVRGKNKGEEIKFNVQEELERALTDLPLPFPVFVDQSRPISFDTNILSLFAIGAVTGLHPAVDVEWGDLKGEGLNRHLEPILKELAKQCAGWYGRVFPEEPLGQMPELYLNSLIYPPLLIDEALPAQRSSNQLLTYFLDLKLKPASINAVSRNLALSPDDLISQTGIVLALSTMDKVSQEFAAICEAKGAQITLLRRAVNSVRVRLGFSNDWIENGVLTKEDELRVEVEKRAGLIPWLILSNSRIAEDAKHGKLKHLISAMTDFNADLSMRLCAAHVDETPSDIELRLQYIKLVIIKNDLSRAETLLRSLISEPDAERFPRLYHLWGICRLEQGDIVTFKRYCRSGLTMCGNDNTLASDLMNNLGWAELCEGNFEEALKWFSEAVPNSISPTTALINKAHVLYRLKRIDEARAVQKKLLKLAPCDRRVFASVGY